MIYEHPLAYVLALEGMALMRSFTGEHVKDIVDGLPAGVALDAACPSPTAAPTWSSVRWR